MNFLFLNIPASVNKLLPLNGTLLYWPLNVYLLKACQQIRVELYCKITSRSISYKHIFWETLNIKLNPNATKRKTTRCSVQKENVWVVVYSSVANLHLSCKYCFSLSWILWDDILLVNLSMKPSLIAFGLNCFQRSFRVFPPQKSPQIVTLHCLVQYV